MRSHARRGCPAAPAKKTTTTLIAFAAFLSYACGGCLSNEYVIPKAELARLVSLPPEQRGQKVSVVQSLGERRSDAIEVGQPAPPEAQGYGQDGYGPQGPPPEGYVESGPGPAVGVGVIVAPFPPPLPPLVPPLPGVVGHHGPSPHGPWAPGRAAPAPRRPTGGRGSNLRGLRGGSGRDEMVALVVVFAVLASIGIIATEGVRYDGNVAMYPWQGVHLRDSAGTEREVPLAQLTPGDLAATSEAVVMDDEGWGLVRLGRGPLNRRGFAYKMNVGGLHSSCACLDANGAAADIQLGYFPHHTFGILADWSPAGGSDANGDSFYRHNLAIEAQFLPLGVWRLHFGGFAHAGMVYADDVGGTRSGAAFGGGFLLELALTTRLALTARADYTSSRTAPAGQGWQGAETFSAGIAVY
jgi:hypothetical protein